MTLFRFVLFSHIFYVFPGIMKEPVDITWSISVKKYINWKISTFFRLSGAQLVQIEKFKEMSPEEGFLGSPLLPSLPPPPPSSFCLDFHRITHYRTIQGLCPLYKVNSLWPHLPWGFPETHPSEGGGGIFSGITHYITTWPSPALVEWVFSGKTISWVLKIRAFWLFNTTLT